MRRRRDKRIWYVTLALFVAVFLFTFLSHKSDTAEVEAASLKDFDPGYIISDYQMGNYQSMTEAEIQAFLTAKNGCKNTDRGLFDSLMARYKTVRWNFKNGHFVCLSEEVFGDGVAYGDEVTKGGETAAHIIWQAAQDYKINPQVLIVLLEKEQGLITDPYPHSGQYRAATGYGCPDTAPCAEQYYGFKNQVRKAAALFRTVLDGGWTNYPLGNNYIQYNPSTSCGGSVVNVKNLATSALYRYTPYQPNAAALAAGYGTAECGAYGNRNFYLYFEDWFGGARDEEPAVVMNPMVEEITNKAIIVDYSAHVQDIGWMDWTKSEEISGTTGRSLRLEALNIKLEGTDGIMYESHLQDIGWEGEYKKDGNMTGTTGESRRLEAIKIKLTTDLAESYDVCYRAHVQNIGWMDWVKNDAVAGTTGKSLRLEAIQIKLMIKDLECAN